MTIKQAILNIRKLRSFLTNHSLFFILVDGLINRFLTAKIYFRYAQIGLESNEMRVLQRALTIRGETFIDIGACHGMYSFWLSKNFRSIIAFEPDSKNYSVFNVLAKTLRQRSISIIQKAVATQTGLAKFFLSDNVFLHTLNPAYASQERSVIVETTSLNDFVKTPIDLIKVDVQGVALDVLRGADKVTRQIKRWIIELERYELEKTSELENLLQNFGYETEWLSPQHIYAYRRV